MGILNQLIGAVQAASSIIGSSLARDVVRIMDSDGNSLFPTARIMRATVREESTFFEHPLEDGSKVADHKIDKPVEIQLAVIITDDSYGEAYSAMRDAKKNGTAFVVQTKTGSYSNQYIQSMPHEETPDAGDSIAIALTFREVQWFSAEVQTLPATEVAPTGKGANAAAKQDASTVKQGQKKTTDATTKQRSSVAADIFL